MLKNPTLFSTHLNEVIRYSDLIFVVLAYLRLLSLFVLSGSFNDHSGFQFYVVLFYYDCYKIAKTNILKLKPSNFLNFLLIYFQKHEIKI